MIEIKKISDVFEVGSSKRVFKREWTTEGVPFYRAREVVKLSRDGYVDNELFISEEMFKEYSDKYGVPQPGDLLITGVGTLGICYQVKNHDRFYFKDGNIIWLKKKKEVSSDYIEYCYKSSFVKRQIESTADAAVVGTYTITNARETKIPLPPLETQKKIAAILDEVDKLRQLDKQLIEKYDELTQSLFLDMFGEKGKYKQVIIEDLVTKITDGTHHTPKYTDSGVPFLRVTDITKSNDSKKFISRDEHEQLIKRCNPEKGDVLYTKNGTIGIAKLVDWDYEFSIFVSLCLLKPRHDLIHNKFLESFLNTPFALKQAMRHSKTGTITNLHLTEIKKIKIPLPSMEIQLEFVNKVQAIDAQKALAQKSLEKSEELFNSLLQKAFKGELV